MDGLNVEHVEQSDNSLIKDGYRTNYSDSTLVYDIPVLSPTNIMNDDNSDDGMYDDDLY